MKKIIFTIVTLIIITVIGFFVYTINKNSNSSQNINTNTKIASTHYSIESNQEIISGPNISLPYKPWHNDSTSFYYYKFDNDNCGHGICDYSTLSYPLLNEKISVINESAYNTDNTWTESPDKKMAIKIIEDITKEPSNDLGTIEIKNLETQEINNLGKKTYSTGYNNSFTSNSYSQPHWSPNNKWIAFYNDEAWDEQGRGVSVISADSKNISEMLQVGQTNFIEAGRGDTQYFYWSPDSKNLLVKDSYKIFSINPIKLIYESTNISKLGSDDFWRWSPNSEYIMGIESEDNENYNLNIINLNTLEKNTLTTSDDIVNLDADWSPDSKNIIYVNKSHFFIYNLENKTSNKLTTETKNYKHPRWSPNGKYILYQINNSINLITLK